MKFRNIFITLIALCSMVPACFGAAAAGDGARLPVSPMMEAFLNAALGAEQGKETPDSLDFLMQSLESERNSARNSAEGVVPLLLDPDFDLHSQEDELSVIQHLIDNDSEAGAACEVPEDAVFETDEQAQEFIDGIFPLLDLTIRSWTRVNLQRVRDGQKVQFNFPIGRGEEKLTISYTSEEEAAASYGRYAEYLISSLRFSVVSGVNYKEISSRLDEKGIAQALAWWLYGLITEHQALRGQLEDISSEDYFDSVLTLYYILGDRMARKAPALTIGLFKAVNRDTFFTEGRKDSDSIENFCSDLQGDRENARLELLA